MARVPLPIAQGFYVDESVPVSGQQCVNLFPHIPQTKTITDAAVIGSSGIDLGVNGLTSSPPRGIHVMSGVVYYVQDNKLFYVDYVEDTFGNRTYDYHLASATIINGTSYVLMADNGDQLMIACPDYNNTKNVYIYTASTTTLVQVTDVDFIGRVNFGCYMDGYFIYSKYNSNEFFISDLRDGLAYNALDFSSAESDPDNIVALAPLNGLLYIFGTVTAEQWQNVSNGAGFPFVETTSGNLQKGCLAPLSLIEANANLYWIGGGKNEQSAVWMTNGGDLQKISTPAIDVLINSGGTQILAQAVANTWSSNGHTFLTFKVPNVCCVKYDLTTGLWTTAESKDSSGNVIPWRVNQLVTAYSVLMVTDSIDGRIGVINNKTFTEYGDNISSYFVTPAFDNGGKPFTINSLELMMETGTEQISGAGSTPSVRLAISDNGGRTFYPDISRAMPLTGDFTTRISWDLLGRYSRSVCFKISIDEPIKKVFVKGEIDVGN